MTEVTDAIRTAETFPQLIRATAARYGAEPAVVLSGEDIETETLSFIGLERVSAELARGMLARDVGKGTRIGIIAGNGPFFATAFAAIARMGGIAVPISTTIRANELVRVLRQSDVAGLIVQRTFLATDYVQRLIDALPELGTGNAAKLRIGATPYLRWIVSTGEGLPPTILDLSALTADAASVEESLLVEVEAEVSPSDQMVEIYTSGSMALPKGVKHNHGPVLFRAHYLQDMLGPQRGQQLTAALPMFWVGGLMMALLPNLAAGATTICTERTLRNSRMAMGSVLQEEDIKAMAGVKVIWGLGMSETLGPYSYGDELRAPGYPLCAPMDHFAAGYEVRVADADDNPVSEGMVGEIQVRGYPVTPGLHKIARDQYFTPDGFYHTGDMGFFQGSRLLFTGRNGDMIKTSGSNVSPAEVEFEMQQLDGIQAAYVLGLPDQERGQIVVAAVVIDEPVDFGAVEAKLKQRLSSYKVPRAYVAIRREDVPLLHSNKVARREIAAMLEERLGRIGA
ncbi:MAG TPA: class I adenylate-forming enzyme family protein [Sphingobium sp.]|uniref:class I adenylate-forming enzyme family protein n=1 Tax=Sphingobium sp. TaxID=1912891 RepID=UPI002ED686FE